MTSLNIRHLLDPRVSRRDFLRAAGVQLGSLLLVGTACSGHSTDVTSVVTDPVTTDPLNTYPFTLGVASGDPLPTGVVLWTRLAPAPLLGGGMPAEPVNVNWEIALDDKFTTIVQRGEETAVPQLAHSVHVEVEGLEPDRVYFYRFIRGDDVSPVGRTRTAPAPGAAVNRLSFAFASCQHYEGGYYSALRNMAQEDLNFVVFLGDYIYEGGIGSTGPRRHNSAAIRTLDEYRNRYALYKSDKDLQAAHAACPWIVTWDDHEVADNYAGSVSEYGESVSVFLDRRAAAYQAYYEHMPLRKAQMPNALISSELLLYRDFQFGNLLHLNMLDTRQYRSDQACPNGGRGGLQPLCEGSVSATRTMLGDTQEEWLLNSMGASTALWNLIGNQIPMADVDRLTGSGVGFDMDQWAGYQVERNRLLRAMLDRNVANPIVITGDVHQSWVTDLALDAFDPNSTVVGTEFVGTSIASGGDGSYLTAAGQAVIDENPFVKYYAGLRGYVRCEITPERWTTDYRLVDFITHEGANAYTDRSFVVEAGHAGAQSG